MLNYRSDTSSVWCIAVNHALIRLCEQEKQEHYSAVFMCFVGRYQRRGIKQRKHTYAQTHRHKSPRSTQLIMEEKQREHHASFVIWYASKRSCVVRSMMLHDRTISSAKTSISSGLRLLINLLTRSRRVGRVSLIAAWMLDRKKKKINSGTKGDMIHIGSEAGESRRIAVIYSSLQQTWKNRNVSFSHPPTYV